MRALALDLGASGGKILSGCFDGERITVREIHRFENEPVDRGGHLYWDIERIYANLLEGLRKAAQEGFTSFGVDSFSNDFGLLDTRGHLIGQLYSYRDSRTQGVLEWMEQILPAREVYERTGNQRARFSTLVQLVAQSRSAERSPLENARHLLFVPDLLDYFLCGEKGAEYTIASVSQLYNRVEHQWDGGILDSFGIPAAFTLPQSGLLFLVHLRVLDGNSSYTHFPHSACAHRKSRILACSSTFTLRPHTPRSLSPSTPARSGIPLRSHPGRAPPSTPCTRL